MFISPPISHSSSDSPSIQRNTSLSPNSINSPTKSPTRSSIAQIKTPLPPKPIPSPTKISKNSLISPKSGCVNWSEVTSSQINQVLCVFGTVYEISYTNQIATRIDFTSKPNSFFIYDSNYVYPDLKKGDCVLVEERLQLFNNQIPYMSISDLYKCP
jgi:hypothetical protein